MDKKNPADSAGSKKRRAIALLLKSLFFIVGNDQAIAAGLALIDNA